MPRRKLIAANWKMNKTIAEAEAFVGELRGGTAGLERCDLLLFPPFFALPPVATLLEKTSVGVGAQDLFWESNGAFTGEVSGAMIRDAGAAWVLVGHSERRHVIGENDEIVARKLAAALGADLAPILCVGERVDEREAGRQEAVVQTQLETALGDLDAEAAARVVIAYEPVWAIGTGKTATPADAVAMHAFIRSWVGGAFGADLAAGLRIQYGGSVKPDNAAALLGEEEIDGALIGGASLEAASFLAIARGAP